MSFWEKLGFKGSVCAEQKLIAKECIEIEKPSENKIEIEKLRLDIEKQVERNILLKAKAKQQDELNKRETLKLEFELKEKLIEKEKELERFKTTEQAKRIEREKELEKLKQETIEKMKKITIINDPLVFHPDPIIDNLMRERHNNRKLKIEKEQKEKTQQKSYVKSM
ncbi:hypothetical protein [Helicobacter pylori]|uniref:hypothetical protein n=1 Tax=Helicobacter pylori TaxID=210 RepID=UPI000EB0FB94|nr:hypothetical protein [Helicobacter pylori]